MVPAPRSDDDPKIRFEGHNWEDLDRLVGIAHLHFLQDDDYADDPQKQLAFLVSRFTGPALDWALQIRQATPSVFADFDTFVERTRQTFGIDTDHLLALRRSALEGLKWGPDRPTFFAEFDRLTNQLGIRDDATKVTMVREKLPHSVKQLLAEQGRDPANYAVLRQYLITCWILDPNRVPAAKTAAERSKRPRCGKCKKRGHTASECRSN
jgi:Domain of unknown function (DUF4939)